MKGVFFEKKLGVLSGWLYTWFVFVSLRNFCCFKLVPFLLVHLNAF